MSSGFVVTRVDGSQTVVVASTVDVKDGVLVLFDFWGALVEAHAPGSWLNALPAAEAA